jgi:hypothetical protein
MSKLSFALFFFGVLAASLAVAQSKASPATSPRKEIHHQSHFNSDRLIY